MINKYIRLEKLGFVIWSGDPSQGTYSWKSHYAVARFFTRYEIISAGFCGSKFGEELSCWGYSESLGIGSSPEDIIALRHQLGIGQNE